MLRRLHLALVGQHERTALSLGTTEPGGLVEALGEPVLLARDQERVVGPSLPRGAQDLGDELSSMTLAASAGDDVQLGQVGLLRVAPQRRLHAHHRHPDRHVGLLRARDEHDDLPAFGQVSEPGRQLVGRRRRFVVLEVEVVEQLRRGGEPVGGRARGDRLCRQDPSGVRTVAPAG